MIHTNTFFTSNWNFTEDESELKSKFQMINIAIILSSFGLFFGIVSNIFKGIGGLIPLEVFLLSINILLCFLLRYKKNALSFVSVVETGQFTFLFLFLIYVSEPSQLKHIWIFTYPIVLLYFQSEKSAKYWLTFMISMLLVIPLQPFVDVFYTFFQVVYLSVVLLIISVIIYFYKRKMDEAKATILEQQQELKKKVDELTAKDKLLSQQSKLAVMGEMISMIAHQWRQPLSTVTLSISDLQLKNMLGTEVDEEYRDKTLQEISDTVVYLSETIDDFQTYFAPNKELTYLTITELVDKAINFTKARLEGSNIDLQFSFKSDAKIATYANELIQVILNILNNAIDELIEMKHQNPCICIDIKDNTESYILSIEDNGNGITQENIHTIFEPYYSTKGKNGTGLGLYMSEMIMEKQFNSKIEIKSSKSGAHFSMVIPKKLS